MFPLRSICSMISINVRHFLSSFQDKGLTSSEYSLTKQGPESLPPLSDTKILKIRR